MTDMGGAGVAADVTVLYVASARDRWVEPETLSATAGIAAVRSATDVTEAMARRDGVDCALVEQGANDDLPGLVESLRIGRPDLPVVVLTDDDDAATEALAAGADDFMPRDGDRRELVVRLRAAARDLGRNRVRPQRDLTTRIVELVPVGIMLMDTDGTILFANEYAEEWMELRPARSGDGPYAPPTWEERRPDGSPIADEDLVHRRVVAEGETVTDSNCVLAWPDGTRRHYTAHGAPLLDDEGAVELVVFAFRDTTDRVRRQRDLEFVRQLVEKVGVGVVAYGDDGRVEFANPAFADLHFGTVDDVEGRPVWELAPELDAAEFDDYWDSFAQGETRRDETLHRRSDGATVPVEAITTRVRVGEAEYNVGTVRDVSEREERDERLAVLNRVLRHNLRTELNVVMGETDNLRAAVGEDATAHLDTIETAARRLYGISEKAQRMERTLRNEADAGDPVRVAGLVETAVAALREAAPGVSVTVDVPGDLAVAGDETLRTALDELLTNAVEHNDRPPGERSVTVRARDTGAGVALSVLDNGPGIPPEDRNVLTNDRERTPLYHGSGLGLWLVAWVVRRLDGNVAVVDRDGRGSRVTLELPAAE